MPLTTIFQLYRGGENHWPVASHWQIYHIMLYQVHLAMSRILTLSGDRHTITTTTVPFTMCNAYCKLVNEHTLCPSCLYVWILIVYI
jgi:hypothetical protein